MNSINLCSDEIKNIIFPTSGDECYIGIYKKPINNIDFKNYNLLRGKLIRVYKEKDELIKQLGVIDYESYIENKQKKIIDFSKFDPREFKILNIPLGVVYLNKEFYGSYQNIIYNAETLSNRCYDEVSSDFTDLNLITSFIKQIQEGVKYELHPNDIYTDDLHNSNILVDSNNKIHFIDADSFKFKEHYELSHFVDHGISKEEYISYFSGLPLNKKYLKDGVFEASKERDIYLIYAHYIELITKTSLTYLDEGNIYNLVQHSNFPNEFIDDFSTCFRSHKPNVFLNPDIIDKINTDYKIERCKDSKYHSNKNVYVKCRLVKK